MSAAAQPPLFEIAPGERPLLISMPHSGTFVPPDLAARLSRAALDLPDTDWHVPKLYDFAGAIGASVLCATHSRYVVDLNRPPDAALLYPGRRETGVCPLETFDGEPLYAQADAPAQAEIGTRLARYWRPYHAQLRAMLDALVSRHGGCLLLDAHSIRSFVPELFAGRLPDLNVGTADGRSCAAGTAQRVVSRLSAQRRFTFVVDGRFKGGYITRHYGNPAARVEAVQLEIAQCAYLLEARVPSFDAARAAPLGVLLRELLTDLAELRGAEARG